METIQAYADVPEVHHGQIVYDPLSCLKLQTPLLNLSPLPHSLCRLTTLEMHLPAYERSLDTPPHHPSTYFASFSPSPFTSGAGVDDRLPPGLDVAAGAFCQAGMPRPLGVRSALAAAVVCDTPADPLTPFDRLGTDAEPGRDEVELASEGGDDVPGRVVVCGGGAVRDCSSALSDRSSFCRSERADDWDAECFSIICV